MEKRRKSSLFPSSIFINAHSTGLEISVINHYGKILSATIQYTRNRTAITAKSILHCKKELAVFPSPAGMSLIKLFLGGKNIVFSRPERVWSVTSRLETGKWLTPFYSVALPNGTSV